MRVPLSWLGDFLPLQIDPTDRAALGELGRQMDSLGLVVESIDQVGAGLDGVVLAHVLEISPIEGADRIRRVLVDAGRPDPIEIVCGAWNFQAGDVVPLATVGAELPNGMVITRRKMRGAVSDGMLCSPSELGLPGDSSGLLVLASPGKGAPLPEGIEAGMALAEHLGIVPDAVYDIAIEVNRPDALSVAGIARDLGARLGLPFTVPPVAIESSGTAASALASVATLAPSACDRIVGRVVTGITPVVSSPLVARRLLLSGMRPINSVVDASNYVMLELGQPTHPYDLDRLAGHRIVARPARPGEVLVTLDGAEQRLGRALDALGVERDVEELVIADGDDRPVGLAGVMGGADSEVSEATSRVLLEAAHFDPLVVGRAAKRRGIRTEASARFERGVDPEIAPRSADRVLELIVEAARRVDAPLPVVAPGLLEDRPVPPVRRRLVLRTERLNGLLGTALEASEAARLLEPIGFDSTPVAEGLEVEVPSFRPDVSREVDLIEEVARHHGYEAITPTQRRSANVGRLSVRQQTIRRLRRILAGSGAMEAWTSSLVDARAEERLGGPARPVGLANPIVAEESVLRTSLLAGLVAALRHNVAHRNGELRLFELGAVFAAPPDGEEWPEESEQLAVLLARGDDDVASALGSWESLVEGLRLEPSVIELAQGDGLEERRNGAGRQLVGLHPSRRALLVGPDGPFGALGELDPAVLELAGIPTRRVGWLTLDVAR
ncbi:MAG: pheT, partial [Acidimicrobiaceae bacterium]|nr:pheT [Acidimicrobiaceae bacterium]